MRVLVDHSAAFNQGAGIGRYARNLVPAAHAFLDQATFRLWYAPANDGPGFAIETLAGFRGRERWDVRRAPISRLRVDQLWFRARLAVPIEALAGRSDVVYSPDFTAPPSRRAPRIMTIHDLAYLIVPERSPPQLRRYLSSVVEREVRRVATIACVSETTKRDVIDRLRVAEDRVVVIPNGVDRRFFDAQPLGEIERTRLGLPQNYLLIVGTIEPRKNHLSLFAALDRLPADVDLPLVVAGRVGWQAGDVIAAANHLVERKRVILLDYVEDAVLPSLIAGAAALVYPSWYEGFGLPVLEGLAAGVPVVASDVPAHREVAGDAATFVDPHAAESIAAGIEEALAHGNEPRHRAKRRHRAEGYTWDRSGALLARLLTDVGSGRT